jgi:hypothetical protein
LTSKLPSIILYTCIKLDTLSLSAYIYIWYKWLSDYLSINWYIYPIISNLIYLHYDNPLTGIIPVPEAGSNIGPYRVLPAAASSPSCRIQRGSTPWQGHRYWRADAAPLHAAMI